MFDQFKSSQAGNADDIVNRLRQRHAAGKEKDAGGGAGGAPNVNNELGIIHLFVYLLLPQTVI